MYYVMHPGDLDTDGENLLYLAVEVRDDDLVLSSGFSQSDACEVYVVGTGATFSPSVSRSGRPIWRRPPRQIHLSSRSPEGRS